MAAVMQNGTALHWASWDLRGEHDIVTAAMTQHKEFESKRELMLPR
jgi:hypothetical protein